MMLAPRSAFLGLLFTGVAVVAQTTGGPPAWEAGSITQDGTCGPNTPDNWVCTPKWGACCGPDGVCGRREAFCGTGWYVLDVALAQYPVRSNWN
jgi:hypothetical protein